MNRTLAFLLLSAAFASYGTAAPVAGQLCVAGKCVPYSCGGKLPPIDSPYVFCNAAQTQCRLGVPASDTRSLACDGRQTLKIRIGEGAAKRVHYIINLAGKTVPSWEFDASGTEVGLLDLPAGKYDVTIAVPHFARFRKTVDVPSETTLRANLAHLPRLTGTITDGRSHKPVANGVITSDKAEHTVSDAAGRFALESDPHDWPTQLTVNAARFATAIIRVPPARADAEFGEVLLHQGTTVNVTIEQERYGQVVELDLQRVVNGIAPGPIMEAYMVAPTKDRTIAKRFESVDAGKYIIVAKGADAGMRLGKRTDVSEGEPVDVSLKIDSFDLSLHAQTKDGPLSDGRVDLKNLDGLWQAAVSLDDVGSASKTLWQAGKFTATISALHSMPFRQTKTVDSTDRSWSIDIPSYEITGTVTDSKTDAPIANASVALQIEEPGGYRLGLSTKTATDGSFRFAPVAHGRHTLKAVSAEYPIGELDYVFEEAEESRNVKIQLEKRPSIRLTVVDGLGLPVSGARVFDPLSPNRGMLGLTDSSGTIPLFVPEAETREIFVVPRDGSLGVIRISAGSDDATLRLGAGNSRIVLRAETQAHQPLARVTMIVRYDGLLLPNEVMESLAGRGSTTASDAQGRMTLEHMPAGLYEFWPVTSAADVAAARTGRPPAVTMVVVPGENLAVLTFARDINR
jgi:hypothetical protein